MRVSGSFVLVAVRLPITSEGAGPAWAESITIKVRVGGVSMAAVGSGAVSGGPFTSSTTVASAGAYSSVSNGVNDAERV